MPGAFCWSFKVVAEIAENKSIKCLNHRFYLKKLVVTFPLCAPLQMIYDEIQEKTNTVKLENAMQLSNVTFTLWIIDNHPHHLHNRFITLNLFDVSFEKWDVTITFNCQ